MSQIEIGKWTTDLKLRPGIYQYRLIVIHGENQNQASIDYLVREDALQTMRMDS